MLKAAIDVLAHPLADLFNKCISIGYFPDILKIAEVIPVHKKGDSKDPNNFRPISILSVLSKIYERFLYNELLSHCERLHILNPNQFGFRRGICTNTAIAKLLQNIIGGINDNEHGATVFLDLQKAFDLVSWTHNINVNVLGYEPMRLVTGKSCSIPEVTFENETTESLFDFEAVQKFMEGHRKFIKKFR